MVTVTLSASLVALMPERADARRTRYSMTIDSDTWDGVVSEISTRFRRLADHLFDESGSLRPGLLVAVNDDVILHVTDPPQVRPGDEIFLFTQIAGG